MNIKIIIDGIEINIEKDATIKDNPNKSKHPIQYNPIQIKRKYYKKGEEGYKYTKKALRFSKFDKIVKQEPLLDPCY